METLKNKIQNMQPHISIESLEKALDRKMPEAWNSIKTWAALWSRPNLPNKM